MFVELLAGVYYKGSSVLAGHCIQALTLALSLQKPHPTRHLEADSFQILTHTLQTHMRQVCQSEWQLIDWLDIPFQGSENGHFWTPQKLGNLEAGLGEHGVRTKGNQPFEEYFPQSQEGCLVNSLYPTKEKFKVLMWKDELKLAFPPLQESEKIFLFSMLNAWWWNTGRGQGEDIKRIKRIAFQRRQDNLC